MTGINLLHVEASGCHPQGIIQTKGKPARHAHLCVDHTLWNNLNIKILKYVE